MHDVPLPRDLAGVREHPEVAPQQLQRPHLGFAILLLGGRLDEVGEHELPRRRRAIRPGDDRPINGGVVFTVISAGVIGVLTRLIN